MLKLLRPLKRIPTLFLALGLALSAVAGQPVPNCVGVSLGKLFESTTAEGPNLYILAEANVRPYDTMKVIKQDSYNVLNLMELQGQYQIDPATGQISMLLPKIAKDPAKLAAQGKALLARDPDIQWLQEVESIGALNTFNTQYLQNRYRSILIEGNDGRSIDIGLLVKRDLPLDLEIQSHKELIDAGGNKVFSRDLVAMMVRKAGAPRNSPPLFVSMGMHQKSKRDSPGDPESNLKRTLQSQTTADVIQALEKKYPRIPIFLAGDANTAVPTAAELAPLWAAGMQDAFVVDNRIPANERITHTFHPHNAPVDMKQMDTICLNNAAVCAKLLKQAHIFRLKDANGNLIPFATSIQMRNLQESDHLAIGSDIDMDAVNADAKTRGALP